MLPGHLSGKLLPLFSCRSIHSGSLAGGLARGKVCSGPLKETRPCKTGVMWDLKNSPPEH
eukprot:5535969-Amphidinium_carterae.1